MQPNVLKGRKLELEFEQRPHMTRVYTRVAKRDICENINHDSDRTLHHIDKYRQTTNRERSRQPIVRADAEIELSLKPNVLVII